MQISYTRLTLIIILLILGIACHCFNRNGDEGKTVKETSLLIGDKHYIDGYSPFFNDSTINAVIEIPAGTVEKWEVDKEDGYLKWEIADGIPRKINYLAYPANYGMIPGTLLPIASGGDGDPLDVIVLGPPLERGEVVRCHLIGILYLKDNGERDDKLVAVIDDPVFGKINTIEELNINFPGISDILQLWFTNYKGPGIMASAGYGDRGEAEITLIKAANAYNVN